MKSFVNRDIQALRDELYSVIKEKTSEWTDFNSSSFESHLIDIIAGVADMVSYYIDNAIQESQLMTARQEKNILGILETMNYPLETMGPAKGDIVVSRLPQMEDTGFNRFTIPKWTVVCEGNDLENLYVTTQKAFFDEDVMELEIPVVQGERFHKQVLVRELKQNYRYYITTGNVPCEWVFLNDSKWEKVEDAFIEIDGGPKYSIHRDNKGRIYCLFTYDWRQYLPEIDDEYITFSYLKINGTGGLKGPHSLSRFLEAINDVEGNQINSLISVDNPEATYGAFDQVDLNLHRANAMLNFKTMDRIILLDDFEAKIREQPWILDCYVCDWRKDITIVDEPHKLVAWVVTVDFAETNQKVLKELRNKLMEITVEMTDIEIKCAEFVPLDIEMNICVKGNDEYREEVRLGIEKVIEKIFDSANLNFGQIITKDDIEDIATRYSSSVRLPEVISFDEPIRLNPTQYPLVTNIKVNLVGDMYGQKTDN